MVALRSVAGLLRSLAIYYARPRRLWRLSSFYGQFVGKGDLAFDIGAHVGNRSLAIARAGARVVALEPQEPFYWFLKRVMPTAVTVLPIAAGPAAATARMIVSRLHPTVSSLSAAFADIVRRDSRFARVDWDSSQIVRVTTLDDLITQFGCPAFVKIDVEGFEDQVLAGLSASVPALAFEYLPAMADVALACIDRLERLGPYEFNFVRGEGIGFELARWVGPADMRNLLPSLASHGRPGDIYARLTMRLHVDAPRNDAAMKGA